MISGCSVSSEPVELSGSLKSATLSALTSPPELDLAVQRFTSDCMAARGFEYAVDTDAYLIQGVGQTNALGIGGLFSSEEDARLNGYATSLRLDAGAPINPQEETREYQLALVGEAGPTVEFVLPSGAVVSSDVSGCLGDAYDAVYGDLKTYLEVSYISTQSRDALQDLDIGSLPEVIEPVKLYAKCMNKAGYSVGSLSDTAALAQAEFGESRSSDEPPIGAELSLAVQDFKCQESVQLRETLNGVFLQRASNWIGDNEATILRWGELKAAAMERAKQIIEG